MTVSKKFRNFASNWTMTIIAPSLLAADFLHLGATCEMLNKSEAEWYHLDVMDGSFVPNISFGLPIIEQIRKATTKVCDVHLMIEKEIDWWLHHYSYLVTRYSKDGIFISEKLNC